MGRSLRGTWRLSVALGSLATAGGAISALGSGVAASGDAAPSEVVRPFSVAASLDVRIAMQAEAPAVGAGIARNAAQAGPTCLVVDLNGVALHDLDGVPRARVELPTPDGGTVIADLERFEVLTADAVIVEMGAEGERPLARPNVQLWRGVVEGGVGSRVFLSIEPGGAQGFVMNGDRLLSIATARSGQLSGRTVISDVRELDQAARDIATNDPDYRRSLLAEAFRCGGAVIEPGTHVPPANTGTERVDRGTGVCRAIRIAVDSDNEFTQTLFGGNATNASAYITTLMGAVSTIYKTDPDVQILVPFQRVWTTTDPYTQGSTAAQLPEFRTYWQANRPAVTHELAHLLSGRSLGGGIAYLSGLCSTNTGYGVSANLDGFFPLPARSFNANNWDLYVTAHEIGHNFSSGHTHEAGSYNPIVDGCGNGDCTAAAQGLGTIMSYCHQCSGGVANIDLTFGPRPTDKIRNYTYNSVPNCGLTLGAPSITSLTGPTGVSCRGGQVMITANTASSSVPLTYTWYRGTIRLLATTPTITVFLNSSAAGEYRVEVSNGCQTVASASVTVGICVADYNCSGGQPTTQDIFDFLAGFFAQDALADVNASGAVTTQDIFDFLTHYFTGC